MRLDEIIMYFFVFLVVVSATGVLLVRQIFHAALCLITCLLSLSGIYLLLRAEFLAVTQVIIYAGGVVVLIIFGILLTTTVPGRTANSPHRNLASGTLVGVGLFGVLFSAVWSFPSTTVSQVTPTTSLGAALFTTYIAPFEIAGILLLVCLVAAAVISSQHANPREE